MTGSRRLKFVILQPPAGSIYKSGEYEVSTRTDCPSTWIGARGVLPDTNS